MDQHFRDVLDIVRADLSDADYKVNPGPGEYHSLILAVTQLTNLVERLYKRVIDLETVQNERGEQ